MTLPPELPALLSETFWAGVIVFLRAGAMMTVLPGLGEQTIPARVRLVLGLMLTAATFPAIKTVVELPELRLATLLLAVLTETVNGLLLGLSLRLLMHALQIAGSIAAQSTSLAQLLGNSAADPMPAIGHLLTISALALLMLTGFHVKIASFLILSYDLLPAMRFPEPGALAEAGRARIAESFILAFTLAAPFVILSALYNMTLGFINKAMPQLMVAFVGAPVITLGAIALLLLTAPLMLSVWLSAVDGFLANPFR